MNVSLSSQMKSWVETRLEGSGFHNASDYVRHLIRCDQEREQAIDDGVNSGPPEPFEFEKFKQDMRERHAAK
ncbi:MAG: type II toxin-antitoxin system ParD family antitoxin [Roseovarius sp.]|nr:type II toxin-antitoxin system ParD family antitoxin [Roseovarius sp.]